MRSLLPALYCAPDSRSVYRAKAAMKKRNESIVAGGNDLRGRTSPRMREIHYAIMDACRMYLSE